VGGVTGRIDMSTKRPGRGGFDVGFLDGGPLLAGRGPEFSASLERGLAILGCFGGGERWLGVSEVAGRLGLSRATAHRYMLTFRALGFVEQGPDRKYRLSLAVTRLGCSAMSGMSLVGQAGASMRALARRTGFVVELGVLDGPEVLVLERVEGESLRGGRESEALGGELRLPVYCTALGKLLLAMIPPGVRRGLLGEVVLERRTPATVSSKHALREELQDVEAAGLALCDGELVAGVVMIAAAVRDERGDVRAALGMSGLRSRISAEGLAGALGAHLVSAADEISARLGYRRPDERVGVAL
jgi:DNA-binding IclR family transcriptional regulator